MRDKDLCVIATYQNSDIPRLKGSMAKEEFS